MGQKAWKPVRKPGPRRMKEWRSLGPEQPIEPINAGLLRVLSRGNRE